MIHTKFADDKWEVWSDCDDSGIPHDGRVVGLGDTKRQALRDAIEDLRGEIAQCRKLLNDPTEAA